MLAGAKNVSKQEKQCRVGKKNVVVTDIGQSWALHFIRRVLGRGLLDAFPNHTFQPQAFVRRAELANALARALESLNQTKFEEVRREAGRVRSLVAAMAMGRIPAARE